MPKRKPDKAFDLKTARESRAMTQEATAALLGAAQSSVSRWEVEGTMPESYRRIWEMHWQLEAVKGKRKQHGKSA